MCKAATDIHAPYAISCKNGKGHVDKSIKLIEKVYELLAIIGFLKSSLFLGYRMSFFF